MDALSQSYEELREITDKRKQHEKEAGLYGEDRSAQLLECMEREAGIRGKIVRLLERDDFMDSMEAQSALIVRYARRKGFDPERCAETWIAHNSREFRRLLGK